MSLSLDKVLVSVHGKLTRYVLLSLAVLVSIAGYTYIVDFYDSNQNFIAQIWRGIFKESHIFYSGSEGGYYIQIGDLLQKESEKRGGIKIHNRSTSGAIENATRVTNTASSFGLIQEDTLKEGDFIKNHINFITPLYLERMHILYRKDRLAGYIEAAAEAGGEAGVEKADTKPHLSKHSKAIQRFLVGEKISTGPHGSGSKIFAGYLLDHIDAEGIGEGRVRDLSLPFKEGMAELAKDEPGVSAVFSIAGAPLKDVVTLLEKNRNIGLMGVDPSLVHDINRKFGKGLRTTTFKKKYDEGGEISTMGSYAFLISSKDVPNSSIIELLNILDASKEKIGVPGQKKASQLEEFDFLATFQQKHESFMMELTRSLFLFIVSVAVTTAGAMAFLVWIVSGYKLVNYFRKLTQTYTDFLPENTNLDVTKRPFPKPIIYENQTEIITNLIRGFSQILLLAHEIREDYKTGGITANHYKHLLDNLYQIRDIFRKNLFRRLCEIIESKKGDELEEGFSVELLRHYHTAGYIELAEYQHLVAILQSIDPAGNGATIADKIVANNETRVAGEAGAADEDGGAG